MDKREYQEAEMEVLRFSTSDAIVTSGEQEQEIERPS